MYDESSLFAEVTEKYVRLLEEQVIPLVPRDLSAAIYTQTKDVEREVNGHLTYDREAFKMDMSRIRPSAREADRYLLRRREV